MYIFKYGLILDAERFIVTSITGIKYQNISYHDTTKLKIIMTCTAVQLFRKISKIISLLFVCSLCMFKFPIY